MDNVGRIAAARGSVERGFGLERRTENKYVESMSKLAEWKIRSDTRRHRPAATAMHLDL
jgi:hypothetical protein